MDLIDPDSEEKLPPAEPKTGPGLDRMWEEYKLVQAKIDKIGDFQFKVKSWSAALLGAVLSGAVAAPRFPIAMMAMVGAAFLVLIFHLSERRQRQLSRLLGRRASDLERAFSELPPISDKLIWERIQRRIPSLRSIPGIASSIVGKKDEKWDGQWICEDWPMIFRWLVRHSDDVFYLIQYFLVFLLMLSLVAMKIYDVWLKN
jgi:hypothetical protein